MQENNDSLQIENIQPEVNNIDVVEEIKGEQVLENLISNEEENLELTDEQKHELYIQQLKYSKIKFRPIKRGKTSVEPTITEFDIAGRKKLSRRERVTVSNVTINPYGSAYKKERSRRNKEQKASRKANRR